MAKYFGFNKPFFNFNVSNIKVDIETIPVKYRPSPNPILPVPVPDLYYELTDIMDLNSHYSKVVFLIRHGARNRNDTGIEDHINSRGIEKSQYFGELMETKYSNVLNDTNLSGYGTDYLRTKETVANIFKGADSSVFPDPDTLDDFTDIHGGLYTGNITDWQYISDYCSKTNWSEISIKSKRLITNIFDKIENINKRYHIMVTHDQLLAPFIYYASKKSIRPTPSNWIYFLSGVALLLNEDNTYEIVPIMGTDDWYEMPS